MTDAISLPVSATSRGRRTTIMVTTRNQRLIEREMRKINKILKAHPELLRCHPEIVDQLLDSADNPIAGTGVGYTWHCDCGARARGEWSVEYSAARNAIRHESRRRGGGRTP
jgi:hypothetical protein